MIFNFFKKSKQNVPIGNDYVFISNQGKNDALIALAKEKKNIIFIGWFSDTINALKKVFTENGLDENTIIDARHLQSVLLQQKIPIFIEHYPLLQKEKDLVEKINLKNIDIYSSLDEAFFKFFNGEKIISMVKLMGIKDNEPIIHEMISKSIVKAQQKIAEKVLVEQSASSAEEWISKNLKK